MGFLKKIFTFCFIVLLQFGYCQGQPAAVDQYPAAMCEDIYGQGRVLGVDLTLLEGAIYGGAGANFSWFLDNSLSTPVPTPSNVTVWNYKIFHVLVTDGALTDTATVTYLVDSLPYVWDHTPAAMCEDVAGSGIASGIDLTYYHQFINGCTSTQFDWFSDAGYTIPVADPTDVTVFDGQIYYVKLTNIFIFSYCTNITDLVFTVNPTPVAVDQSSLLCLDVDIGGVSNLDLTTFNNDITAGSGNTITWYLDSNLTSSILDPTDFEVNNGQSFYAEVSNGVCEDVAITTIAINPTPVADFEMNPRKATMLEPKIEFINHSISHNIGNTLLTYEWDFAGLESSFIENPTYSFPPEKEEYKIHLIITDVNGCFDEITKTAFIEGACGFYMPSAFTPDGNGINDYLYPTGFGIVDKEFSFTVFNRWGEVIYASDNRDITEGWDGSYNGQIVDNGSYLWKAVFYDVNGSKHNEVGKVNILR